MVPNNFSYVQIQNAFTKQVRTVFGVADGSVERLIYAFGPDHMNHFPVLYIINFLFKQKRIYIFLYQDIGIENKIPALEIFLCHCCIRYVRKKVSRFYFIVLIFFHQLFFSFLSIQYYFLSNVIIKKEI